MVHGESKSLVFGAIALACAGLMLISHGLTGKRKKTAKPDEIETAVAFSNFGQVRLKAASVTRPAIASRETAFDRRDLRSRALLPARLAQAPVRVAHAPMPARPTARVPRGQSLAALIGDDLAGELREALDEGNKDRAFLARRAGMSPALIERVEDQQKLYYNELRRIDEVYPRYSQSARLARERLTRDHIRWMEGTLGYETYHRMLDRSIAGL